jgi:hypothetical protein
MEFPGDVFPIFQKKLVIMCILRQKKLHLPQRDSPGLEVETESEVACEQELLHKAAHKGILQAWRLRLAWCRARLASYKVPQRDSPGLEVETQSC